MIYRINVFLLSVIIAFAPGYVFAAYDIPPKPSWLSPSDWRFEKMRLELDALSADINATREKVINGKKVPVKSTAIARIDTSHLVKNINRVGAVGAVSLAITGLIGAVDYVLDPANNRVKYFPPSDAGNGIYGITFDGYKHLRFNTKQEACNAALTRLREATGDNNAILTGIDGLRCLIPGYDVFIKQYGEPYPSEEKYLPYDTVAAEIAKNAAAGDAAATEFVADTISNELDNNPNMRKDIQDQLDRNEQVGPDDEPETPPDPNNPPNPTPTDFKLPAFCTWAAFLCSTQIDIRTNTKKTVEQLEKQSPDIATTAQETTKTREELEKQTEQDKTFYEKVTAWFDWTQVDDLPEKDNTDFEDDSPIVQKQVSVNFGSQCPAPASVSYTVKGRTESIQVVNFEYVCAQAPIIKPSIIALASIGAAFIVFGRGREQ